MATPMVPAGWYADPAGRHEYRYWDGTYWTAGVADGGVTATDPLEAPPPPVQQAAAAAPPATGFSPVQQPTPPVQQPAQPPAQQPAAEPTPVQPAAADPSPAPQPTPTPLPAAGFSPTPQAGGFSPTPQAGGFSPTPQAAAGFPPVPQQPAPGFPPAPQPAAAFSPGPQAGQQFGGGFGLMPPRPADTSPVPPLYPGMGAPVSAPPARRRWPLIAAIAGAVVVILIIGLVIWAPWKSPPLLKPTGLTASTLTTSSVAFHWAGPRSGPLPDKYLILNDGKVIGTVDGSVTAYQISGLAPDTPYQYRVVAERGGKRSAASTILVLHTTIPPISAARWQGLWTVAGHITRGANTITGPKHFTDEWTANPRCATGPCDVRLSVTMNGHSFKVTMARSGAGYRGSLQRNVFPCGKGANQFPVRSTLVFRITLSTAHVSSGQWLATGWAGTVDVASPFTSQGIFFCPSAHQTVDVTGSP
jgi:hypothetical protein